MQRRHLYHHPELSSLWSTVLADLILSIFNIEPLSIDPGLHVEYSTFWVHVILSWGGKLELLCSEEKLE